MFWAKDHGAIVCGAKEIQKKIFGAIVFGQISLGQMQGSLTQQIMDGGMVTLGARSASFLFVTVTKKTMTSSFHTSY